MEIGSVIVRPHGIIVEASVSILIRIGGTATCRLKIEDEKRLLVELVSAEFLGVGASGLIQNQLEKLNPVLDTDDLPLPVALKEVRLEQGVLRIFGTALPPERA